MPLRTRETERDEGLSGERVEHDGAVVCRHLIRPGAGPLYDHLEVGRQGLGLLIVHGLVQPRLAHNVTFCSITAISCPDLDSPRALLVT